MRRIVKKAPDVKGAFKGEKIIIEQFNSFHELMNVNNSRSQNFGSRSSKGGDFEEVDSFEQAEEYLTKGWNKKIDVMKKEIKKLSMGTSQKISFKNDVVGYAPIVPNAILGLPHSMINNVRVPKKAKVINIQICIDFNGNVRQKEIFNWGAELINMILNLEAKGFRVKLEYIADFSEDKSKDIHICRVPMKNENQPLDLKRLMFPLCHVAMLRCIMFDWYERLPDATKFLGYGNALYSQSKNRQEFTKSLVRENNTYFLMFKDNIKRTFEDVK